MTKSIMRLLRGAVVIFTAILLGACEYGNSEHVPENSVRIYRTDMGYSELTWEYYVPKAINDDELTDEILARLCTTPESTVFNKIVPDSVKILSYSFGDEGQLVIDFSDGYLSLEPLQEIMLRAGVVKTMCGLDNIDGVEFTVAGQQMFLNGDMMVGIMSDNDFIDNTGENVSFRQTVLLTVFYATRSGDSLSSVRLLVESNGIRSQEELATEQLIGGPGFETDDYLATLPPDTKLNKIMIRDGICYVDLSEEFLSGVEGISDEVTIYSLVNTLTELSTVNKVRITVDSASVKTYGTVPIDGFLERRPELTDTERAVDTVE